MLHLVVAGRQVVNHHDNADMAEASGPREEINFWKSRTIDLSGISEQLHRADVRKVRACRLLHRPLRPPPACTRLWWLLLLLSVEADAWRLMRCGRVLLVV